MYTINILKIGSFYQNKLHQYINTWLLLYSVLIPQIHLILQNWKLLP